MTYYERAPRQRVAHPCRVHPPAPRSDTRTYRSGTAQRVQTANYRMPLDPYEIISDSHVMGRSSLRMESTGVFREAALNLSAQGQFIRGGTWAPLNMSLVDRLLAHHEA